MTLSFGAHRQKSSHSLSTTLPSLSFQEEAPGVKKTHKRREERGREKERQKNNTQEFRVFFCVFRV